MAIDAEALAPERIRPLRRREYDRLVGLGVFDDERLELLHGTLIEMSRQTPSHADVTSRLGGLLATAVADAARIRQHSPLAVSDDSEPEPDIAVVPPGDYSREHPRTALLVVEVADSSLRKDRKIKASLYAACAVPEYWLVNLVDQVIEVHRAPLGGQYTDVTEHRGNAMVSPLALPAAVVVVGQLLG
jgi:Uma2 family endonuclease